MRTLTMEVVTFVLEMIHSDLDKFLTEFREDFFRKANKERDQKDLINLGIFQVKKKKRLEIVTIKVAKKDEEKFNLFCKGFEVSLVTEDKMEQRA